MIKKTCEILLWVTVSLSTLSGVIYTLSGDDKWFWRYFCMIVCIGFLYLGELIKEKGNVK